MSRRHLRIIEIAIWVAGVYLLVCVVTRPPRAYFVRTVDTSSGTPVVISEKARGTPFPNDWTLSLIPDRRMDWQAREYGGGGSGSRFISQISMSRVDVQLTVLRAVGIFIGTAIILFLLWWWGRGAEDDAGRRGFEVGPIEEGPERAI